MIKPYETINSFTRRPVISQIVAYLVFIGEALTFFICMYVNFTNSTKQIAILVLYIATAVVQIVVTLITSYIDPSDNVMMEFRNDPKNRRNMDVQDCLFCDFCTSYVKQTSRHCKICQRCVQKFDHHCMWINNCVGSKNYDVFIGMIISTFVNMVVYVIGMILLWTQDGWLMYIGPMIAIWAYSVIILVFAVLLLNLICLHMYLIYKGFTTYQFIMKQRDQEKKKKLDKIQQQKFKELQEEKKKKKTSIQQRMSSKSSNSSEEASSSQNSSTSLKNKISIMSKHFQNQQNEYKSDGSSNIVMRDNKNVLQNVLKTEKSEEESTYEAKKIQVKNNSMFENSQQSRQKQDELQQADKQNQQNLSNFFTNNKTLKFFIGTQVGDRPKSATIRNNSYQSHTIHVEQIENNETHVNNNKSMYLTGSKNLNKKSIIRRTSTSLKAVHFKQNYIQNKSYI